MHRSAMTLMEILAVCVVLGLVAMAIAPAVARRRPPAIDTIIARLRAADLELRLSARGQGGHWENHGASLTGMCGRDATPVVVVELPRGMSCTWTHGERPIEELTIDRWGRSADATVIIHDGRQQRQLQCDGVIGIWRVVAP